MHFERKFIKNSQTGDSRKFLTRDAYPTLCLNSKPKKMNYNNFATRPEDFLDVEIKSTDEGLDEDDAHTDMSENSQLCPDISDFCESVMTISKATQTMEDIAQKISKIPNLSIKRIDKNAPDDKQTFLNLCNKFLPESLNQIIKCKFSNDNNQNLVQFALYLYYSSSSYNLLKEILGLPSKTALKYYLLPKTTKLNDNLLTALKCKIMNMTGQEKICSFSIASLLLKPNLYYNIKFDRIIGFHDVDGLQISEPAKYAIVLMVQGILVDWKQPIAYSFIYEYDNFPEISIWIDEVIETLIDLGLDVRTFVSDPRSEFLFTSETRMVSPEKTYFKINGRDIYYIYDSTQLLKVVRNNMKSCNFHFQNQIAVNGCDSLDFFKKLNNLCDMLNATSRHTEAQFKGAYCNKKCQSEFMKEMLSSFQNLKVVRKVDGIDVTENMKFIESFQITIKSVLQLYRELNNLGVKYLLTNRLSHSSLNRFFQRAKGGSRDECTPYQLHRRFVRSFVFNMMKRPKGSDSDYCSEGFSKYILKELQWVDSYSHMHKPLKIYTTDYRIELPEKNVFMYICEYCYKQCIKMHSCEIFENYVKYHYEENKNEVNQFSSNSFDSEEKKTTVLPPDSFTEFLMLLESKFKEFFMPDTQIISVGHQLLDDMHNYTFEMPCPCFPLDYLKTLFVRLRIFYTVRRNNRIYRKKKGVKLFKVFSL